MSLPETFVQGFHDADMVGRMKYRRLGEIGQVSILSLGCSSLGSVFRETDDEESIRVVQTAIRHGINLLDTAPWYGQGKSERVLGQALQGVPRHAYYLCTKVGRYAPEPENMFDFTAERVTASVYESLQRLGQSYIDVIQVHDVEFCPSADIILNETLPALQRLKEAGVVRHIGITGYPLALLEELASLCPVQLSTVLSYCHYTLLDSTLQQALPLFLQQDLGVINASPLSMGLLTHQGPPSWHPATATQKDACKQAASYCAAQGVDISRLALHFTLHTEPRLPTTLVSTASLSELMKNLDVVYTKELSPPELAALDHCRDTIFKPLKGREGWEGLEVQVYWVAQGKQAVLRRLYHRTQTEQL